MNKRKGLWQSLLIYGVLLAGIFYVLSLLSLPDAVKPIELTYSELMQWVDADLRADTGLTGETDKSISRVLIVNNMAYATTGKTALKDEQLSVDAYDFSAKIPSEAQFYIDVNKVYEVALGRVVSPTDYAFVASTQEPAGRAWWMDYLPILIMLVLFGGLWFFIIRSQTQGPNKGASSFIRGRAKIADPAKNTVRYENVAGADEEKDELREVVDFLKDPQKYLKVGARIPKGVLLVGPPGTGKTLLAKAVAGEAGVPFFTISGSDFVEMYVGVGASRVRDLFDQAKKNAPCIIFIDEIDAVGRQRGAGLGGSHDEREQTLNQLLVEMDGFSHNEGVIVMAATNRSDILDPALLRPGRFDRQVLVHYPDIKGREAILKVHSKGKPLGEDVNLHVIAALTPMFTGADLENVMNEAALLTARQNLETIGMDQIEEAINRVSIGLQKKSRIVTPKDKKLVAYHEAGHAIVSYFIPECDKVQEITTIPRGLAGGYTKFLPDESSEFVTSAKMKAEIASYMGGHMAEQLIFSDVTTGASMDIRRATQLARSMVTEYGMSEALGPIFLAGEHEVFLGKNFQQTSAGLSEDMNKMVDKEIRRLLDEGLQRAKDILTRNMDKLNAVVGILLEKEHIDGEEFECFMEGRPYVPKTKAEKAAELAEKAAKLIAQAEQRVQLEQDGQARDEKRDTPPDAQNGDEK